MSWSGLLQVHERMHAIRKRGSGRPDVATVAEEMIKDGGTLLCFDEFNVTDVRCSPYPARCKALAL